MADADPPAQPFLDLRVDESVGDAMACRREAGGKLAPLLAERARAAAHSKRPVDELAPRSGLIVEGRSGRLVLLLEDARHAGKERRAHLRQRLGEAARIG
jgi:hypothetical protein